MPIEIPDKFMGKPIKGAMKRALAGGGRRREEGQKHDLVMPQNINLREYIQVPGVEGLYGESVVVSPFEVQGFNNMNYEDTHRKIFNDFAGQKIYIYMPTPAIFMPHFKNVVDAHHGRKKLYYADGFEVAQPDIEEIYRHLTINHKKIYQEGEYSGAWTWLNAHFKKVRDGKAWQAFDLETIAGLKSDGNFEIRTEPLEACVWEDCFAGLEFNKQGLATRKFPNQKYEQGENLWFYFPRDDDVAGLYAYSDWADLGCDRYPQYSSASLGVFLCAEGARAENLGDKNAN